VATVAAPHWHKARIRRSLTNGPGIHRVRRGRGFAYLDEEGERVEEPELLARIDELVIPPAWKDVWISPYPGGHIQATGIDEAGRKQYLYHPKWRESRDRAKFDDMVEFAHALPALRERVEEDLRRDDLSAAHVLATATRLLDRGFFRIGSEDYAVTNESYGLATIQKRHVRIQGDRIVFDYPAKSNKRRIQSVVDPEVSAVIEALKKRRGGGPELLAYKRDRRWVDLRSPEINAYLKEATGLDISAKDFRTWGATVLAAIALAVAAPNVTTATASKRAMTRAIKEVAHYLGNTPAVARASYIDPRVFDAFQAGRTVGLVFDDIGDDEEMTAIQGPAEEAVLDLLEGVRSSEYIEKIT
jgi:DNA topoisomerase IB